MEKRELGYVLGSDMGKHGRVWKVRVNSPDSTYHGLKLIVASVRNSIELAVGLNVNFLVGEIDDEEGQPVPRAVDVQLGRKY